MPDYELRRLRSQDLEDFKDDTRDILNRGKYQLARVTALPTHAGNAGELVLFQDGTDGQLLVFLGTGWNVVALFTADSSTP